MSVLLCTFLSVLPVYVHCMYVFLLSLLLLDGILLYWIFVCFCSAAPDKLTSPPPFTGLGALHAPSLPHMQCGAKLTITVTLILYSNNLNSKVFIITLNHTFRLHN